MLWVAFARVFESVFLSSQDLGPSVVERILFGLKLLLFLFQASRGGNELSLEAFLFKGFLWKDEIFVAIVFFGDW